MNSEPNPSGRILRIAWWILFALAVSVVVAIRIRLLAFPLERDEGEYAYTGQLILHGIPPYKIAYNMKFPGTYAAYALIMGIFGQTVVGIHLGLLIVNAATVALLFFIGWRLLSVTAGITAAASYAVLSISPSIAGFAAHATHFVVLPVLGGALLLLRPADRQSLKLLFVSGLLFGLGLLMKQPAIMFVLFGAAYLLYRDYQTRPGWKRTLLHNFVLMGGALTPLAITCSILWGAGVFERFWFWTVHYAREYGGLVSLSEGAQMFWQRIRQVIGPDCGLWVLALIGLSSLAWSRKTRAGGAFLVCLLVSSSVALCAGFYFREHYFVLVLPAISLLIGAAAAGVERLSNARSRVVQLIFPAVFCGALALSIFNDREFFRLSPDVACRMIYYPNPFSESVRIGDYLREHTNDNDQIAVLGSEPQIYFYSDRRSASGYIYTYALMEPQRYAAQMQREMIHEIEAGRPKYLVLVAIEKSWLARPDSDRGIFAWTNSYCAQNYILVGLVKLSEQGSAYYFSDVPSSLELAQDYILIYERKT